MKNNLTLKSIKVKNFPAVKKAILEFNENLKSSNKLTLFYSSNVSDVEGDGFVVMNIINCISVILGPHGESFTKNYLGAVDGPSSATIRFFRNQKEHTYIFKIDENGFISQNLICDRQIISSSKDQKILEDASIIDLVENVYFYHTTNSVSISENLENLIVDLIEENIDDALFFSTINKLYGESLMFSMDAESQILYFNSSVDHKLVKIEEAPRKIKMLLSTAYFLTSVIGNYDVVVIENLGLLDYYSLNVIEMLLRDVECQVIGFCAAMPRDIQNVFEVNEVKQLKNVFI